jgi:hypothetical protein
LIPRLLTLEALFRPVSLDLSDDLQAALQWAGQGELSVFVAGARMFRIASTAKSMNALSLGVRYRALANTAFTGTVGKNQSVSTHRN